jgi:hypothetical protein
MGIFDVYTKSELFKSKYLSFCPSRGAARHKGRTLITWSYLLLPQAETTWHQSPSTQSGRLFNPRASTGILERTRAMCPTTSTISL